MSDEPRLSPERRADMEQWLTRHISRRRRRRRNLAIAGVAGAGVVSLGLVAWVVLAPQEVQDRWVECYAEASLDSAHAGAARSNNDPIGDDRNDFAVATCELLWEQGLVDGTPHDPAPELALCARPDRLLVTFPRGETPASDQELCADLGLLPPAPAE